MRRGAFARLESWARAVRRDAHALWLAARDPRMPRHVRWLAAAVAAYALSPIDLIPDFVPVLGLLDDLLVVPLGLLLVVRLAPPALMSECRARAAASTERPVSRAAAALVVTLWVAAGIIGYRWLRR